MASVTLSSATAAARARFERTTPRERWLLTGLLLAGLAAAPWASHEWAARRAADAAVDLQQLQALREADDAGRLGSATARLRALDARVQAWSAPAPSFAVARVLAEQDVAAAAAQAGLTHLDVQADESPQGVGGVGFVRVALSGDFSRARMAETLRRLALMRPGAVVERAASEGEGAAARLRLVVLLPFRTAGPS